MISFLKFPDTANRNGGWLYQLHRNPVAMPKPGIATGLRCSWYASRRARISLEETRKCCHDGSGRDNEQRRADGFCLR